MIYSNSLLYLVTIASALGNASAFSFQPVPSLRNRQSSLLQESRLWESPQEPTIRGQASESPCSENGDDEACKLIICQITDVYSLEHLASFKTMVQQIKEENKGAKVVSMLTGDFLSPYLLSTVDHGAGMMNALNKIPLDYLTWGNHEADIDHDIVCKHVRNFQGTFINSNMLDHEAMDAQQEYDVIQLCSPDGSHERKVGLCAVLSDDPALYAHFPAPGAFGGATITDPWETLTKYQDILENEEGCDMVLPLQHLYVPDDHKTCRDFDFPLILSGHDHHVVDETVEGTRLIKPGMNAVKAAVVEVAWEDATSDKPTISARFEKCSDYQPEPVLAEENERAYDALLPLRNTELASVPSEFQPLSSGNARGEVCTMGKFICTMLKDAVNSNHKDTNIDAVLLMGGNIRGNVDEYPMGSFFSLETLQQETKSDEVVGIVEMPGWLLAEGIEHTHSGDPIPGWMQYDNGIRQDKDGKVTHVGGEPLARNKRYRVATKIGDVTNGQSPPWVEYFAQKAEELPGDDDVYFNVQAELMNHFARSLWQKLWSEMSEELADEYGYGDEEDALCDIDVCDSCPHERLEMLDSSGNGVVSVSDIQEALHDFLGMSVDQSEMTLAQAVHAVADINGDGKLTLADFEQFCSQQSGSSIKGWESEYDEAASIFEQAGIAAFMKPTVKGTGQASRNL